MIEVYAIREKGTNKYLPYRSKRRGGGNTHDDPIETKSPRLLYSYLSAVRVLSAWLQGTWKNGPSISGDYYMSELSYPAPTKVESRKRENMEIVKFELKEIK